jgi:PAS domain S-box-containing protein
MPSTGYAVPDFRTLFESAPALYLVVAPDLTIVAASDAYLRATKTKREEILGRGLFDVFPDNPKDPTASGVARTRASMDRVRETRAPDTMPVQRHDIQRPEAEGGGFEKRFWSPVNTPVLDSSGDIVWIIHRVEDVTGSMRVEHQLKGERQSLAELRMMVESVRDYAILMLDKDGLITSWNEGARRIKGYEAREIIGKSFSSFYSAEDVASGKPAAELEAAARDGRYEDEGWRVRKDGSRFWANVVITALRDEGGSLRGFCKLTRDFTEREENYQRIREANRLKSEFLANMSHELRTPLNAIIGFSELIHDGKAGPVSPDQKEYLGDILTSSQHLLQLINDVLDLSKVESGKMEFRPQRVDLAKLTTEAGDILRTIAAKKRIVLHTFVDPSLSDVVTDPAKLKQVLYNYLSNALKFTPEEGRVALRVLPEDGGAFRIEVEDSGIGIAPEDIARLFVEFQQLDTSASKRYPGTGLGLALTKRIVEAQGGHVGVTSIPGKGSVFFASLARSRGPAGAPSAGRGASNRGR